MRRLGSFFEILAFAVVVLAVFWVPVPLGSNRPYAWYGLELLVFTGMLLWLASRFLGPRRAPWPDRLPNPLLLPFLVWLAYIGLQAATLPEWFVRLVNPGIYELQLDLAVIGVNAASALSADPGSTVDEMLKYAAYTMLFFLTVLTARNRRRLVMVAGAVVLAGLAEAIFGFFTHLTGFVVFPEKSEGTEFRTGTFVNANHYANLLGLVCCLLAGVLISLVRAREGELNRLALIRSRERQMFAATVFGAALTLLLLGILIANAVVPSLFLLLTLGAAVLIIVVCNEENDKGLQGTKLPVLVPLFLIALGALSVALFAWDGALLNRIGDEGDERMLQARLGIEMWREYPWFGVGAGNYQWIFTHFKSGELRFNTYDHAHNDYIEVLCEQGIAGFVILGLCYVVVFTRLLRGYRDRRDPIMRGVVLGALMAMMFMAMHALIEFNFRIPANAVFFYVIMGIGVAASTVQRGSRRTKRGT